jgi:Domain of unknown function (DUF4145)
MLQERRVRATSGEDGHVKFMGVPDTCPLCHEKGTPDFQTASLVGRLQGGQLEQVFRCPSQRCGRLFIAQYTWVESRRDLCEPEHYRLAWLTPTTPREHEFPKEIVAVSPMFVKIFNQAAAAETRGLDEVDGMGYRRALEFLVKDFAAQQNPDQKDTIRNERKLGAVIETYIAEENVKECAKRAAWLGNDEAHYIRVWEDKDLEDLKRLVRATVAWIELRLITSGYIAAMPKGKTK